MTRTIIVGLPAIARSTEVAVPWWIVANGSIVERGLGSDWLGSIGDIADGREVVVGLAPAAAVRLSVAETDVAGLTPRQAAAVLQRAAIAQSLGDPETLHAVSAEAGDGEGPCVTAVVANAMMLEWLDWAGALGVELDHIVPVVALLEKSENWVSATIGTESIVGRRGLVLPNEPILRDAIVAGAEVVPLDPQTIDAALAKIAVQPRLDLRTGRFAKRRTLVVDRERIRKLLILASLIPAITLAWAIASVIRLDYATSRLDAETVQLAEASLGREVALETAEADVRQFAGSASTPGFSSLISAVLQHLQREAGVTSSQIGFRRDGILALTLAAPTVDEVNRILVALQRDGFRITAVPRQVPDGRAMVDITVRSGP